MYFFLLLALTISSLCHAQPDLSLYDVVIDTTASQPTSNTLKEAFRQLIYRLTPGPEDLENPVILNANPSDFLRTVTQQTHGEKLTHYFSFEPDKINRLMRDSGQPPWINNRPILLTWVTFASAACRLNCWHGQALTPEQSEFYAQLEQAARSKGLTLVYPDASIQGYFPKGSLDCLEQLHQQLVNMKKAPQALLHFKISERKNIRSSTDFTESWNAYYQGNSDGGNKESNCSNPPPPKRALGQLSIENLSQFLFEQEEQGKLTTTSIYVRLSNLCTMEASEAADCYIKHIPGIQQAEIVSVTVDSVLYKLQITIPPKLLDARLSRKYTALLHNPKEGILNYRLTT